MALVLKQIFTSGSDQISQNYTIESWHVSQSIDAFTGNKAYDITLSGSFTLTGSQYVSGSISASLGANTVGFFGTSSWAVTSSQAVSASQAVSSSYAISSSYAVSSSYAISSSYAVSASYAISSSYATSASYAISSSVAISSSRAVSSSYSISSSVAISSSYALSSSYASNGTTDLSVGAFYDVTNQVITASNSASMILGNQTISNGIVVTANSQITVTRTGTYNLQFSAQVSPSNNGTVYIWLRKNGTNLPYTNTGIYLQNANQKGVAAWNFVENLNATDYLELIYYWDGNPSSTLSLIAEAPLPSNGGVGVPSIIVTINQIK